MNKLILLVKKPGHVYKCLISYIKYGLRAKEFHYSNFIERPLELKGIQNLSLGKGAFIRKNAYINILPFTGESHVEFKMGDHSHLNYSAHVIASKKIIIGKDCNIAPYVYIADNTHSYKNIDLPIKSSPIQQLRPVSIGDGTWIGTHAAIIGCSIGKHCVIGANSVVTKDIPDYCVAVGIPAKIIKRYDFSTQSWRKTNPQGEFIN
ncbi:acyltransferase [Phocaeicola barnesiae]|uniref:acyltransferase n=1 Tax=Phocaeicola barnesiae TaxID=376804 RepID=UPI0025A3C7B3|nr:acyltransferase [Phocaeicola barnesiae]MDM8255769.1 acyltransferase [Phocaeicola barnesiae]